METVGAIFEGEWNSFSGMCSEETDFMAQLLGNYSLPNEAANGSHHAVSDFWPSHDSNVNIGRVDESSMYSSEETNTSMYSLSQGSSYSGVSSFPFPSPSHESYYPTALHPVFVTNKNPMTMDYGIMENKNYSSRMHVFNNNVIEGDDFLNQDISNDSTESNGNVPEDVLQGKNLQLGPKIETPLPAAVKGDKLSCPSEISKKRSPRVPEELPRSNRNTKLRKCMKNDDNDEEINNNNNVVFHRQSSSSCISEGESNASHEQTGVTSSSSAVPKSNGKARANRGSASDPQSLYARKRREKINERLRILQNLVPNGTKVDISTMLEEAVQYVKFLQLQIKLLSSDDHWMYSPIAYNGMDIGLDLKISPPKSQT